MSFVSQPSRDFIRPTLEAVTPFSLYLERMRSVSDKLRAEAAGLEYIPMYFGGIKGQQESLVSNAVVKIVNFKVTNNGE